MEDENQSTLLLKKEREDWEVQEKLRTTREKVAERLKECRQKKLIFERKQAELQDTVTKNEQFIRDTDAKIEKAEKKAREETLEMRKREEDLSQYNKLRDRLLEEQGNLESEIWIITMAIEQLYQRAQQSCRDDRRRNAMLEYTESKFGHREDLVLACVSERLVDLMWMVEEGKKEMKAKQGNVQVVEDTNLRPSTPKFVMVPDEPGSAREKSAGNSGVGTDSLTLSGPLSRAL